MKFRLRNMKNVSLEGAYLYSELFFLCYFIVYYVTLLLRPTMFEIFGLYAIDKVLIPLGYVMVLFRCCMFVLMSDKRRIERRTTLRMLTVTLVASACFIGSYISTGYVFLLFFAFIFPCLLGMDKSKILMVSMLSIASVWILFFIAAASGDITDLIYPVTRLNANGASFLRSSFGMNYPTDCAALGFFFLLTAFVVLPNISEWVFVVLGFISAFAFWYLNNAQNNCAFTLVFVVLLVCHSLVRFFEKKSAVIGRIWQKLMYLTSLATPFLAILMYAVCRYYNSIKDTNGARAAKLDIILHSRPKYGAMALEKYGVTLFGTAFRQVGNGGTKGNPGEYFFLDSTYMLLLIRYGLVILVLFCLMMMYVSFVAAKRKEYRLSIVMLVLAGDFFLEHHALDLQFNVFVLMPFLFMAPSFSIPIADLPIDSITGKICNYYDKLKTNWNRNKKSYLKSSLITIVVVLVTSPLWMSVFRTMNTVCGFTAGNGKLGNTIFLCVDFLFLVSVICICLWKHKVLRILGILGVSVVLLMATSVSLMKGSSYAECIDQDEKAITAIQQVEGARLYSDQYPLLFFLRYGKIRLYSLPTEEMARFTNVTMIVDKEYDSTVFISRGFVYAEISDSHGIYTNSREVSDALQAAGYVVRGYHYTAIKIEENTDQVYEQLCGNYEFVATLHCDHPDNIEYMDILQIKATALNGEVVLFDRTVYSNELDEEGNLEIYNRYWSNYSKIRYEVSCKDQISCEVEDMYYHRYQSEDVRRYYNAKWLANREEYLDDDGNIMSNSSGYAAVEYEYDKKGNIVEYRYYDEENHLTDISDGEAIKRVSYDKDSHITSITFFDADGIPVLYKDDYAGASYEYDNKGNQIKVCYYDTEGNLSNSRRYYAIIERRFDEYNRNIYEQYRDAEGKIAIIASGYAAVETAYDENNNPVQRTYYDTEGNQILTKSGYARVEYTYDENDIVIEERYYDEKGEPIILTSGKGREERSYDDEDRIISRKYYGADNSLILYNDQYAEVRYEYNLNGKVSKESYFDIDGNPGFNGNTYASVSYRYDSNGRVSREDYYDWNGDFVVCNNGYASIEKLYDENGNIIEEKYYDTDQNPGRSGESYAIYTKKYNVNSKVIEEEYKDKDNHLINRSDGYARVIYNYEDDLYLSSQEYYDENNDLVNSVERREYRFLEDIDEYLSMDHTIVYFVVRDEAANQLNNGIRNWLKDRGLSIMSELGHRESYIGIIDDGKVVYEDRSSQAPITYEYGNATLFSAGYEVGNNSSCMIDGMEYGHNSRGFNVIVYDKETKSVIQSLGYDTYAYPIRLDR